MRNGFFSNKLSHFGYENSMDHAREISLENGCYIATASLYGVIALVALVQLLRIQLRVPEYGWTTQKVFHLLNFFCSGARCGVMSFRQVLESLQPRILTYVALDAPGLLFFSTYSLLVLFWAEIYHQARKPSSPPSGLRPAFIAVNLLVYTLQVALWTYLSLSSSDDHQHLINLLTACFMAGVSTLAAVGFTLYGGRLFIMLRRFPSQSPGRRKKLKEVGCVTSICTTCFTARAIIVAYSAFNHNASLDVIKHPVLNLVYYLAVEIIPSALVLFILRKLPPKRPKNGYQPIS
mmetsp:Transcript_12927/g.17673  ORF Transcript_12927/g.17673 Transcript_12927/m.17673 type:complete len:292 (-) Transcript_12927:333-1208(-)|eukprot:CAMPEP_0196596324 /NCGR_PEP_ID=MMETSP1081-20130531/85480_1 /TAXON_ID=36882 /ORGANISM="Pyramimonas amylifera, Strain CCMP720" /LENGTH=291 /DNA_ID=CAMNT_0041921277 /DNA_START=167 /DNA_END=1042 /DNA_ORIENTATION=+